MRGTPGAREASKLLDQVEAQETLIKEKEEAIDQWQKILHDLTVKSGSLQAKHESETNKWNRKLREATEARDATLVKCAKKLKKDLDEADKIEDIKRLTMMQRLLNEKRNDSTKEMKEAEAKLRSLKRLERLDGDGDENRNKLAEDMMCARKVLDRLEEELSKLNHDLSKLNKQVEMLVSPAMLARMKKAKRNQAKNSNVFDTITKKIDDVKGDLRDDVEDLQTVWMDTWNFLSWNDDDSSYTGDGDFSYSSGGSSYASLLFGGQRGRRRRETASGEVTISLYSYEVAGVCHVV